MLATGAAQQKQYTDLQRHLAERTMAPLRDSQQSSGCAEEHRAQNAARSADQGSRYRSRCDLVKTCKIKILCYNLNCKCSPLHNQLRTAHMYWQSVPTLTTDETGDRLTTTLMGTRLASLHHPPASHTRDPAVQASQDISSKSLHQRPDPPISSQTKSPF